MLKSILNGILIVFGFVSISFGQLHFRDDLSPAIDDYYWTDTTPWYLDNGSAANRVPVSSDNVFLHEGRETLVNGDASCNLLYIGYDNSYGKLMLAPGSYTLITNDYLCGGYNNIANSHNLGNEITQDGGTISANGVNLGFSAATLTYNLNAGTLTTKNFASPRNIIIGNGGSGLGDGASVTFNQTGGTMSANGIVVGQAGTTGVYNMTGGVLNGITSAGNIKIGAIGAGSGSIKSEFNLGDAFGTGTISCNTYTSLYIDYRNSTLNGWGIFDLGGSSTSSAKLYNEGVIKANGYGKQRTLDLSQFYRVVSNGHENIGTNGYYAVNGGRLKLPSVSFGSGRYSYNWGEDLSDTEIDLVNSARITFTASKSGKLYGSLLSGHLIDNSQSLDNPSALRAIGIWDFKCAAVSFNTPVNFVIRYDASLAAQFQIPESSLKLYHYAHSQWVDITTSIDTSKKQISGTSYSFGLLCVGVPANLPVDCDQVHEFDLAFPGDLNQDCAVDIKDLVILCDQWLMSNPANPITADINGNHKVELNDFGLLAQQWREDNDPRVFFPISDRVWNVDKPLYSQLFSNEPLEMVNEGVFMWAHLTIVDTYRKIGKQFGMQYIYEDSQKLNAQYGLTYLCNPYTFQAPSYNYPYYDQLYGLKNIVSVDSVDIVPGHDYGGSSILFPDPVIDQGVMDEVDDLMQTNPQFIWAIYAGDETIEKADQGGVITFASANKPDYITQADAEIKALYGNGVYGIPLTKNDTNPYRWIAYRRWLVQKLVDRMGSVYNRVKNAHSEIKIISYDPIAGHHPFDFSSWYGKCDILTHQLYPLQNSDLASFGFTTKLIKDISGIEEIWPCFHVENYAASFTPEEVLEMVSEGFRNGATGFHLYLPDVLGLYNGINYLGHEYYGAPERWQLLMKIIAEARKMKKLQFPQPDFAVLYSCDTYASQGYYVNESGNGSNTSEIEYAYTLLGPNPESWFKFIDDNQLERQLDISNYKAVYVPFAKYERQSAIQRLEQYTANGGTLIAADPEAFSFNAWADSMASYRSSIFGVTLNGTQSVSTINYQGLSMPVYGTAYNTNTSGCTVLATFNNGTPAIVSRPYGSGRAIFFAVNPFSLNAVSNQSWKDFFSRFNSFLGIETDQKIWRFRFPYSLIEPVQKPQGKCLTNNYIFWQGSKPFNILNYNSAGTYKYNVAPDQFADVSDAGVEIPFSSGKLTNRWSAANADNSLALGKSTAVTWMVRYADTSAFSLTVDLKQAYAIGNIKLFTSGQLPKLELFGSNNAADWLKIDETDSTLANSPDVIETVLNETGLSFRYLRIDFKQRSAPLDIAEIEIWTNQ
ncbi:MAG: beta-galactosidase trimerization domain-containing protein [Phycisphaerales bacterium]